MEYKDLALVLVDRTSATKKHAFTSLSRSDTLQTYFPKYQYHGPKQKAVAAGAIVLRGIPEPVATKIESEVVRAGGWRRGSQTDLNSHHAVVEE